MKHLNNRTHARLIDSNINDGLVSIILETEKHFRLLESQDVLIQFIPHFFDSIFNSLLGRMIHSF